MNTVAVDDIYVSTGGYDANFADFFKVVGKTAKSVKIVPIGKKIVREGDNCMDGGTVVADPDKVIGEVKTVRVSAYSWNDNPPAVTIRVKLFGTIAASARKWEGNAIHEYNHH